MYKLKKIILNLAVMSLAALPVIAMAQGGLHESSSLSITSIGIAIVNALWIVFTVIAVICFVIAGIMFLTAYGESEKLKQARSMFLWGVVGVVVALLAYGIIALVRGAIGA